MNSEILLFIAAFIFPFLYYRTLLFLFRKKFDRPYLREKTKLKIHHLHYGMIFLILASFILLFYGKNNYVVFFLGLGLGLMYDEFIPALIMKSNRKDEMNVYRKALIPTAIMFLVIIALLIIFSFLT
jgi:hypothetical protein